MSQKSALVAALRQAASRNILQGAGEVLQQPLGFRDLLQELCEPLEPEAFYRFNQPFMVSGVEPKVFVLHEDPSGFQIVLNHFDRRMFDHHLQEGRITPHFHQFSFATRTLSGGYYHVLYDNDGELRQPKLRVGQHHPCEPGTVYTLRYDRFHCALEPQDDTLTLMIRGPRELEVPPRVDPAYSYADFTRDWERVRAVLAGIDQGTPGVLASS